MLNKFVYHRFLKTKNTQIYWYYNSKELCVKNTYIDNLHTYVLYSLNVLRSKIFLVCYFCVGYEPFLVNKINMAVT